MSNTYFDMQKIIVRLYYTMQIKIIIKQIHFFFVFGLLMLNLFKLKLLVAIDILLVLSSTCLHCPIRVYYYYMHMGYMQSH